MSGRNFVGTVGEVGTTPWITVEMHEDGGFGSSHVQLRFRKGTSLEEVKATAKRLNQDIEGFLLKPNRCATALRGSSGVGTVMR